MGGRGGQSIQRPEYDRLREAIRSARLDKNLSQRELSRRLGMMATYISKVESGERRLDVIELADIFRTLDSDLFVALRGVLEAY